MQKTIWKGTQKYVNPCNLISQTGFTFQTNELIDVRNKRENSI